MVDDEGVAAGPLPQRPAELLGELGLRVGREHLQLGGFARELVSLTFLYTLSKDL